MVHPITSKYDEMKELFNIAPLNAGITDKFKEMNDMCYNEISTMSQIPITSRSTAVGKQYIVFSIPGTNDYSRPVNIELYESGLRYNDAGQSIIDEFWDNVKEHTITNQSAEDITAALYAICMNYCCCTDLLKGIKKNAGDYFEKLVGHLYAMHLLVNPTNQMNALELDGESIPLPTDFIFDLGPGKPKFHVPAKTSTRERVVEVWSQQRVLDGAFGVGRFLCLLTCIGETNFFKSDMSVALTCVPNQWINYQLFISQIKRAYYLDVPEKYAELNDRFPKIHVKTFGEFFHESNELTD
ncbi:MAG: hypothetical protein PUC40_05335 [Lachnospiraceae bacterium]|nr:hypothetical protein [Lachnospiraceae bacterium]